MPSGTRTAKAFVLVKRSVMLVPNELANANPFGGPAVVLAVPAVKVRVDFPAAIISALVGGSQAADALPIASVMQPGLRLSGADWPAFTPAGRFATTATDKSADEDDAIAAGTINAQSAITSALASKQDPLKSLQFIF